MGREANTNMQSEPCFLTDSAGNDIGTLANPLKVAAGSGPQSAATSQSVVPATDAAPFPVQANAFWTEGTAPLAANAVLNGALRNNGGVAGGAGSRFSFFVAEAFSDVAGGTLYIDKTVDGGATYRQVGSIGLAANTSVTLKVPVSAAGYRARVVNGGTPQTAALVTAAFSLS